MKMMAFLKEMKDGDVCSFPDGTEVVREDVVEDARPGRKVVVCGDTCDASALARMAEGCDVLVHEVSVSWVATASREATS